MEAVIDEVPMRMSADSHLPAHPDVSRLLCLHLSQTPFKMPWSTVELKDGRKIPQIAFGSAAHSNESTSDIINQAIDVGFDHVDTAQSGSIVL